jgi:hypothetical protein
MRIKIFSILLIAASLISCGTDKKEAEAMSQTKPNETAVSEGYRQMQQKCFICHFEKMDPAKKDVMIAPPMARVQEHYKPSAASKEAFVETITKWVLNPSETNALMPGAVRKFNLMPKLPYEEADIKLIAETLYDLDFGDMPKMRNHQGAGLKLNAGKKWKLNPGTIEQVKSISQKLGDFTSDDVSAYQQLGREIFDNAKTILLDKSYTGAIFDQIHFFFNGIEGNMHLLIAARTVDEAKKHQALLVEKFKKFNDFFE